MIVNNFNADSFHDFSLGLELSMPREITENLLHIPIQHDKKTLFLQTPRLQYKLVEIDEREGMYGLDILFKGKTDSKVNEFYSFVRMLEERISNFTEEMLQKLAKDITVTNLFKSSIHLPENLHDPLYLNCFVEKNKIEIYNRKKEKLSFEDFMEKSSECNCTFILACEYVKVTPTKAQIDWKID